MGFKWKDLGETLNKTFVSLAYRLPPSLHSSLNHFPSNFIPTVYKRAQKDWIIVLLVLEPGVQINSETKAWPRKLSLEINIVGDGDMVCPNKTGFHSVSVCRWVCVCVCCGWRDGSLWFAKCFHLESLYFGQLFFFLNLGCVAYLNSHIRQRDRKSHAHTFIQTQRPTRTHWDILYTQTDFVSICHLEDLQTDSMIEQRNSPLKIEALKKSQEGRRRQDICR